MSNKIIEALEWRYAVKKYDSSKSISDLDLTILQESIRLTPTSFGLQPLHVFIIKDKTIRQKLFEASYGQSQVVDASHLIVFAAQKKIDSNFVDNYMKNVAKTRNLHLDDTKKFGDYIKSAISPMSEEQFIIWNTKQTYLALGFLMHTAAVMRIDATPMEGFKVNVFDEVLGLKDKGMTTTIICPIGYRSHEDKNQFQAKVRKSMDELFTSI